MTFEEAELCIMANICYKQEICSDGICKSTGDRPCAIEVAIESLEKQIPKKPKPICIDYGEEPVIVSYNCTNCGLEVGVNYADGHKIREHHCHCGQKIDWSEV